MTTNYSEPALEVESVEMNEDVSLNGLLSCPVRSLDDRYTFHSVFCQNFDQHVANLEQSPLFVSKGKEAAPFLRKLQPFLGDRPIDFSFMVRFLLVKCVIELPNLHLHSSMYVPASP